MNNAHFNSVVDEMKWPAVPDRRAALTMALLYQMESSQYLAPQEILRWQLYQLGTLLDHSHITTPFYRKRLDGAGYKPGHPIDLETWSNIPLLTRSDIQAHNDDLESDDVPEDHGWTEEIFTSGSTGQPIRATRTELSQRYSSAITLRDHLWHRRDMSGKLAVVRDSGKGVDPYPEGSTFDFWGSASGRVFNTGPCVALNVMCNVEQQMEWLVRENPDYLLTHPTIVDRLAHYACEHGIDLPNLKQIETLSEILRPSTREICRKAWNVPVVDMYSTREVGYIALQCPDHEYYHVQSEDVFVEVLDEDGLPCAPGETGRVVITPLHNFAMPLIRYEIGDYAEVGAPCDCGRGQLVLTKILGRKQNMLVLPGGETCWPLLSSGNIDELMQIAPINQFQFVQQMDHSIELRLVTARDLAESEETALRNWVHTKFGHPFEVTFQYFDEMPRTAAGKLIDFVSEIAV